MNYPPRQSQIPVKAHLANLLSPPLYFPSFIFYLLSYTLILWWLTGCTIPPESLIKPTATPDPSFYYRAALQPWAQNDLEVVGPLPRYHITARLSDAGTTLQGVEQITLTRPDPALVFRLYPNLANYGGSSQVTAARVNGLTLTPTPLAGGSAIRLEMPPTSQAEVMIELEFSVQLTGQRGLDESAYTLFGWDGLILSLPGFYPSLAVRQGNEWALDIPPRHGDVLFNEVALYQLDLTLPHDLVVAAGGVTLNVIDHPDRTRTWQIAGGPLRDLTVIAGPFQAISDSAAGATVTTYYLPGQQTAAKTGLAHAAASLRLYSDLYGPYPYQKLDVVEAPLNTRGMEYSGLVLIGQATFRGPPDRLTFLVAHEVAHQWWYALVGNNPYRYPWLDEGLAEYSAFEYYRGIFGERKAEALLTGRWFIPFDTAAGGGIDGVVDRPAAAFDPPSYELLVYAKSALFFHALRKQLGEATYRQIMQTYYAENRYRLVTPQTFLVTTQRVSGQNLNPLAERWLK